MAHLRIEDEDLIVELNRLEKVEAVHSDLRVPLRAVRGVEVLEGPMDEIRGMRAPGLGVSGRTAVGKWRRAGTKVFVAVHHGDRAIRVRLRGNPYSEVIVGSDDPERLADRLRGAVRRGGDA